jgi:hypothetical protein
MGKEQDTGPRGGDQQPAHEGGREGTGTRPSEKDAGWKNPGPSSPPPGQSGKK